MEGKTFDRWVDICRNIICTGRRKARANEGSPRTEDIKEKKSEVELEIEAISKHKSSLMKAIQKYPDLEIAVDRWKNKRYYTKSVNSIADKIEVCASCGCCPGASIKVFPHIEFSHMTIYSDPPAIYIGKQKEYGYGVIPDEGWQKRIREYNISENIVEKVEKYFKDNSPEEFKDDDT